MASDTAAPLASQNALEYIDGRETVVLIATADDRRGIELSDLLRSAGHSWILKVVHTSDDIARFLVEAPPDLCLLDLPGAADGEFELLDSIRSHPRGDRVPVVCLLGRRSRRLVIEAFGRRADDVISSRTHPAELIARLQARLERPPLPRADLPEDPVTGALRPGAFAERVRLEVERVNRGGSPGALAYLALDELPGLEAQLGPRKRDELVAEIVRLINKDGRKLDLVGISRGLVALFLPDTHRRGAQVRLDRLSKLIYEHEFVVADRLIRLTPIMGFAEALPDVELEELEDRAWAATAYGSDQLDLHPTRWDRALTPGASAVSRSRQWLERGRTPLQVALQLFLVMGLPFALYAGLYVMGIDITAGVYLGLVIALALTALAIWMESRAALRRVEPPEAPAGPAPPATAVIAAYLPNESATVIETIEAFLGQDYPDLQVILAYNRPRAMAIEAELWALAERDPRFEPLLVEGSVSKAQNVNAALAQVRGEFVGLFDADHHPEPGSFHRAWRWIASGAGIVQGHCVIRNGDTNFVTRLVAAEFEAIYAVSHPGRAHLHGFGIFGGSNGYWRSSLLHRTRLRGSMLTEDIDSSMRVVQAGETIISDPGLISTELAPDTIESLWNQRLRWAQGWSQVSLRHLVTMLRAPSTTRRRLGLLYLLGWREIYPWVSLQMVPLLVFWWIRGEPPMNWFVPIFVFTSLFTFSAGIAQAWFAWRLAHHSIRRHPGWFVLFLVSSLVIYTEFKNIIARTAHIKEAMRERKWKVTPRSVPSTTTGVEPAAAPGHSAASDPTEAPIDDPWLPEFDPDLVALWSTATHEIVLAPAAAVRVPPGRPATVDG